MLNGAAVGGVVGEGSEVRSEGSVDFGGSEGGDFWTEGKANTKGRR